MPDQKLLKKLLIKPGYRLLLLNAPGGFVESLNPVDKEITIFLTIRHKVSLREMRDIYDELLTWLRAAYETVG